MSYSFDFSFKSNVRDDFFRIDMHVHSLCSDGVHSPASLVNYAKRKGLDGIAIVDHAPRVNVDLTVKRRFKIYRSAIDMEDFIILPGVEFSFPEGHVLAIFPDFNLDFSLSRVESICDLYSIVRDFEGVLIAAHVYRRSGLRDKLISYIDCIDAVEVYPLSRSFRLEDLNVPLVAGSDSHTFLTLGFAFTVIMGCPTSIYDVLELIKSGNVHPVLSKPYFLRRILDCSRWLYPKYLVGRFNC